IRVVNLRKEPYDVYIGRAGRGESGLFGNPVVIGRRCPFCAEVHHDGGSTLPCYRRYLAKRTATDQYFLQELWKLVVRVQETGNLTLGCFCKPKPCHGDVLAQKIHSLFCKCGYHPCNPSAHAGWQPK
ncbi:MAG: DUF4326 domain-containing protein, partial [Candidatus Binatia bacterium]